jgi:phosphatidylinositol 4-kinase A
MSCTLHTGQCPWNFLEQYTYSLKLAPGDDLVMSTMYSLLNYVAASSKTSEGLKQIGSSPYMNDGDAVTNSYVETGLRSFTDEEKRLVSISTVCVVSTLALEFKKEEVCSLVVLLIFLIWS